MTGHHLSIVVGSRLPLPAIGASILPGAPAVADGAVTVASADGAMDPTTRLAGILTDLALALVAILAICALALLLAIRRSAVGYEDDEGFHFGVLETVFVEETPPPRPA